MAVNFNILILNNITKYVKHCIVYKKGLDLNKILNIIHLHKFYLFKI